MKTARLLVTQRCVRNCPNCCNKYPKIMEHMRPIYNALDLQQYDILVLTGGEPLLYPDDVYHISWIYNYHRRPLHNPVYLYTTLYKPCLDAMLACGVLDGLTFTLHTGATHSREVEDFYKVQKLALRYPDKSFRAVIYPGTPAITIVPDAWKRLTVQQYETEAELMARQPNNGIPDGEDLLLWCGNRTTCNE